MIAEGSSSLFGAEVPWIEHDDEHEHDYQFFETFVAFCSNPLRVLLCSIACDAKGAAPLQSCKFIFLLRPSTFPADNEQSESA